MFIADSNVVAGVSQGNYCRSESGKPSLHKVVIMAEHIWSGQINDTAWW